MGGVGGGEHGGPGRDALGSQAVVHVLMVSKKRVFLDRAPGVP
jgi:hypothetical protein